MLLITARSRELERLLQAAAAKRQLFVQAAEPATFSSHKAHLYCTDVVDVTCAWGRVRDLVEEYGLGAKLATTAYFAGVDRHKGVTLYLPRRDQVDEVLDWLTFHMDGWPVDGPIPGDAALGNGVHTRFELARDFGRDVTYRTYRRHYRPAGT
jgi:hypothetical protein